MLAWCEKNAITYICPMEVLMEDMRRTLRAHRIRLPGSEEREGVLQEISLNKVTQGTGHLKLKERGELPDVGSLGIGSTQENPRRSRLRAVDMPRPIEFSRALGARARSLAM